MVARAWPAFLAGGADWLLDLTSDVQLVGAAVGMLRLGCDSGSVARIASVREHDSSELLAGLYGTFRERGLELPLSADAIKLSADYVMAQLDAGTISPDDGAAKLWFLADRDADLRFPELQEFRDLAVSWALHVDQDCEFDLDPRQWRSELLSRARRLVHLGGLRAGGRLEDAES
jgi:hypothetical protein